MATTKKAAATAEKETKKTTKTATKTATKAAKTTKAAEEVKAEVKAEKKAPAKKAAPKKEAAPKAEAPKAEAKKEAPKAAKKPIALPNEHDYKVILEPVITEKSMALLQNENKVTVKVADWSNKDEIKLSFQRLYQVKVVDIKIVNVNAKEKSRGGRYKGFIGGYKKAIVTIAEGEAVDLFKE